MKSRTTQSGAVRTIYITYSWEEAFRLNWRRWMLALLFGLVMGSLFWLVMASIETILTR